jgi:hypothetical protein
MKNSDGNNIYYTYMLYIDFKNVCREGEVVKCRLAASWENEGNSAGRSQSP